MVKLRIIMRKFSIIGHYFITPGRYSCPGVSPARGGWPWNAGNAPVCGGAGEGRESEGRFRERWFRRWFREWLRELVVAGMVSRPVPGGGFGGGYGHGGRPSGGDVWAGWFGAAGSGPEMGVSGQNKGRPHRPPLHLFAACPDQFGRSTTLRVCGLLIS